jgi:hypothetical protein
VILRVLNYFGGEGIVEVQLNLSTNWATASACLLSVLDYDSEIESQYA